MFINPFFQYICIMNSKALYIRNMVCPRCVTAVEDTLSKLNIPYSEVVLGKATIEIDKAEIDLDNLDSELQKIGFELINDKNRELVSRIKALIISYIHHSDNMDMKINFSDYIAKEIGKDYSFISSIFSKMESTTIEKYIIAQKIERVKELLSYDEHTLSEIAYQLSYSSVQHLSNQFKKITGKTPSQYKKQDIQGRKTLDVV